MKNVLLAAPNSYVIRNWIAGGLAGALEAELGVRAVVASPFQEPEYADPAGRRFANHPLEVELLGLWRRLLVLRAHVFAQEVPFASSQMTRVAHRRDRYHWAARLLRPLAPRGGRNRRRIRRAFERRLPRFEEAGRLLDRLQPALLITGTFGVYPVDLALLSEARRRDIPRLCVVNSWDNMTTRGSMICRPDRLAVWNEYMRRQAARIHGFPEEQVEVVGALQMVPHAEPPTPGELEEMYRRIGLAGGDPYLLYVSSQLFQEYEVEEVRLLAGALARSEFRDVPLVVRLHPQAHREAFAGIAGNLFFDQAPPFSDRATGGASFGFAEVRHLAALLGRAEAVFSTIATTAILEAVLLDRPAIQLLWTEIDRRAPAEQVRGVRWSRRYPHIQFFDSLSCTAYSRSPADLEETLREALGSEELEAGRARALEQVVRPPLEAVPARIVGMAAEMID